MVKKIIFPRFGVPRVVISDGGKHFSNKVFENLLVKHGVKHKVATPYHPQTCGQVELSNWEIKGILEKTVGKSRKHWASKLDDALWLEYKALWATKLMNFNLKPAAERRLIQLNELDEIRLNAYESYDIYKERTKALYDKKIILKNFTEGDKVLLFNFRFKLFPGKLCSRLSGPFVIKEVRHNGSLMLLSNAGEPFAANGQRLKLYIAESNSEEITTVPLTDLDQA
ncbi:uncharacterized protein LOC111829559 [Capsella rubella]|uniref:uncharacterized protein LOC111829559 n=1 Tax=Capsella rubella TaxID=81985 RepID=UPI000CD5A0A4|nr:uncharacterized protein LOC111829559 [Capsella rubella]